MILYVTLFVYREGVAGRSPSHLGGDFIQMGNNRGIMVAGDDLIISTTAGTLTAAVVLCIAGVILQTIIRR